MRRFIGATALCLIAGAALAAPEPIRFADGAVSGMVDGQVQGAEEDLFSLSAKAGQTMILELTSNRSTTYVNVFAPGDLPGRADALFNGPSGDTDFPMTLPEGGDYTLQVIQMGAAEQDDLLSDYALKVTLLGGAMPETVPTQSYMRVTGITTKLNMRAAPSAGSGVVATLANQELLYAGPCQMAEGREWCSVSTMAGQPGWVAGSYLEKDARP
ncbi:MAG: hypothetical protein CSA65_05200 [Proteobacteria bacterium]|nr:MAG: hypothetical protein CSA65_05200 [Pseudomonadota bacterium]